MEWVETTGKSIDEAKELALDQLGVLEDDADFEVLEEPKAGLFGRTRGSARVRARVSPTEPPPKQERRRRNGRNRSRKSSQAEGTKPDAGAGVTEAGASSANPRGNNDSRQRGNSGSGGDRSKGGDGNKGGRGPKRSGDREMMPEKEQCDAGEEFLQGLLAAIGYEGTISSAMSEDGILSFDISGDDLGLLIGPGLNTLDAVQEVCRNAIQRQADGRGYGKVSVDVAGVRADRTESLEAFVRTEAQQVIDSGDDVVFEVMSRGDRKIVHDVIGEFDDLETESVGEDPRRRVVLKRA
ncbi:MAG: protein jag [Acidimicrobiia bacterium]